MILAGDIGGTKTLLALSDETGDGSLIAEKSFRSAGYGGLEDVLEEYLKGRSDRVEAACFAVAGPVLKDRSETTNLPWIVDARGLESRFGIPSVRLLNDLEATAYGVPHLKAVDLFALNEGNPVVAGTRAVIAAGTGLGEAILVGTGAGMRAVPSEGGHTDFGPRSPVEVRLLAYLERLYGHVSYERILSGPGLANLYRFMKESEGAPEDGMSARMEREDPGAVVSEAALSGESEVCMKALGLFVSIYGAEAGNLALKSLSTGGLYIGGGIAPRILDKLRDGTFMKSFVNKGRYASLLSRIPVRVILNPKSALLGAVRIAASGRTEDA